MFSDKIILFNLNTSHKPAVSARNDHNRFWRGDLSLVGRRRAYIRRGKHSGPKEEVKLRAYIRRGKHSGPKEEVKVLQQKMAIQGAQRGI